MKHHPFSTLRKALLVSASAITFCWTAAWADGVYTIYPVPQQQTAGQGTVTLAADGLSLVRGAQIDAPTERRLAGILAEHHLVADAAAVTFVSDAPSAGPRVLLGVAGSGDAADQRATALNLSRDVFSLESKYDRHLVHVGTTADGAAEILILGENTNAVFYGLASLEQMLDAYPAGSAMPAVTIADYADQQNRGIVEGYYGVPYPIDVKKDLMRFMMRYKMNSYMYGAKSDPYHSSYWRDAYPTSITETQKNLGYLSQSMVREIAEVSAETKVNFIWAIHPGNSFLGSSTVVSDVMNKFTMMYQLGVRQFAVFVDDVSIPSTAEQFALNAQRVTDIQRSIEAKWNTEGAAPADTVKPLQFVPQIYCSAFASGETQRRDFFTALAATPANVAIYTTGWGVWSVPNSSDVNQVRQYLGRDVAWWWNYPCNDNDNDKLFPADMYTNFSDESHIGANDRPDAALSHCLGVLSNPMQQGEISKIALFSVADYAWNNDGFSNAKSYAAAIPAVVGNERAEAFATLVPYIRYFDDTALSTLVNNYKNTLKGGRPNSTDLKAKMVDIITAAKVIREMETSENESDRLFFTDLKPWLNRLDDMAQQVIALLDAAEAETPQSAWEAYATIPSLYALLDTDSRYEAPRLAGSVGANLSIGATKVHPAHRVLYPFMSYMLENALGTMLKHESTITKARLISNIEGVKGSVSTLNGVSSFVSCVNTLQPNQYVGLVLPQPMLLSSMTVADTLTDHFALRLSDDGKTWKDYADYDADSDYVRYVKVVNNSGEPRSLTLKRTVLSTAAPVATTLVPASTTVPGTSFYDGHNATYLTDGDYTTYTCLNRNQQANDAYVVKLKTAMRVEDVRICMGTVNGDYMNAGRVQVSADGKKWTSLKVKGTSNIDYRMSLPQVVKYSDEMSYCDFTGTADTDIQYVRLYLSTPNTSKWLRLYEIEVNKQSYAAKFAETVTDASGKGVAALSDAAGHTAYAASTKGSLTYHFYNPEPLGALQVFSDITPGSEVSAEVLCADHEWQSLGTVTQALHTFSLTDHPYARALRLSWNGKAPLIYEMREEADPNPSPEVVGITTPVDAATGLAIRREGATLHLTAGTALKSVTLFTLDGRPVIEAQGLSGTAVSLPMMSSGQTALILCATMADGRNVTSKVIVK